MRFTRAGEAPLAGAVLPAFARLLALAALALTAGCASLPSRPPSGVSPLVYDEARLEQADTIVVALPGVLNSVAMFDPLEEKAGPRVVVARYRYPGLDGLALDHRVTLDGVAEEVAALLARHPDKRLGLIGFSAGGQIAIETAARFADRHPRVAVISGAIGFPETVYTALRGGWAVARLSLTLGTFDREKIWRRYYPILLYGEEGAADPANQAEIARIYARQKDGIVIPTYAMLTAQAGDLTWRRLRPLPALADIPILMLHGTEDPSLPIGPVAEMATRLPNARLAPIEGGGHLLYLTHPEVFDRALAHVLAEPEGVTPRRPATP